MDTSVVFRFLKELAANNNREWFNAHRDRYEAARQAFDDLLGTVINRLSVFDPSVRGIEPKDCTYRIYRDTRFSEDKTPYKTHFGGYINAKGKKSNHCGYYIHVEPDNCMLAGGSYCLPSPVLRAVRQAVYDNIDEFRSIVEDPPSAATSRHRREFPERSTQGLPQNLPLSEIPAMQRIHRGLPRARQVLPSARLRRPGRGHLQTTEAVCRLPELHHRRL